jgi:DNA-binding IclR family transcriptional regulator
LQKYANSSILPGDANTATPELNTSIGSRNRILHILQLFDREQVWTVEAIARAVGVSISSAYRDVQELSQAGFLDPVVGGSYALGPAFIHFDRLIRLNDPLIHPAIPIMRELLARTTQRATAVLCRRYRECVMCVHQEHGDAPHPFTTYERGVAMPLYKGATSKAILAHLDERILKRQYLNNEEQIRDQLGCTGWLEFRNQMQLIRRAGHAMTVGEVAPDRVGIAAPVLVGRQVIAGMSLVLHVDDCEGEAVQRFSQAVRAAAAAVSDAVSPQQPLVARG